MHGDRRVYSVPRFQPGIDPFIGHPSHNGKMPVHRAPCICSQIYRDTAIFMAQGQRTQTRYANAKHNANSSTHARTPARDETRRVGWEAYPFPSAADVLRKLETVVGPGDVFVLYRSAKMFGLFIKGPATAVRKFNRRLVVPGHSPRGVRYKAVFPPCNESLRVTWGGIPPQGEALFIRLLLGGIPPRSQSVPMIIAWAVCHLGDRKRREEFSRRFKERGKINKGALNVPTGLHHINVRTYTHILIRI